MSGCLQRFSLRLPCEWQPLGAGPRRAARSQKTHLASSLATLFTCLVVYTWPPGERQLIKTVYFFFKKQKNLGEKSVGRALAEAPSSHTPAGGGPASGWASREPRQRKRAPVRDPWCSYSRKGISHVPNIDFVAQQMST